VYWPFCVRAHCSASLNHQRGAPAAPQALHVSGLLLPIIFCFRSSLIYQNAQQHQRQPVSPASAAWFADPLSCLLTEASWCCSRSHCGHCVRPRMMALAAAVVQTAHMHMGLLIGSCTMPASRSPLGAPRMVSSVIIYSHARTPAHTHARTQARTRGRQPISGVRYFMPRDNATGNALHCKK